MGRNGQRRCQRRCGQGTVAPTDNNVVLRPSSTYTGAALTLQMTRPAGTVWGFAVKRTCIHAKVRVKKVQPGSVAEGAGLFDGDHILAIDGIAVQSLHGRVTATLQSKSTLTLTVEPKWWHRAIGSCNTDNNHATLLLKHHKRKPWGFTLRWNTQVQGLIVVSVPCGTPASKALMLLGDKVVSINGKPVDSTTAINGLPIQPQSDSETMTVEVQRRVHWGTVFASNMPPATDKGTLVPPTYNQISEITGEKHTDVISQQPLTTDAAPPKYKSQHV